MASREMRPDAIQCVNVHRPDLQLSFVSPLLRRYTISWENRFITCSARPCYSVPRASFTPSENAKVTRRQLLWRFVYVGLVLATGSRVKSVDFLIDKVNADVKPRLNKMEKALVPIVMCRTAMTPVKRYIEIGAWDRARTNINYCTRNLALKRRIRETAESGLEDDAFYNALDIAGSLDNTMSQLDASVYTPIFVASDEGISEEQLQYQEQARGFYKEAITMLDNLLESVPKESLTKAREVAKFEKFEIRIDKE